jgi:FdhE protein
MTIGEKDRQVLYALTMARDQHPELADLLDFYHDLFEVQFRAKAQVPDPGVRDDLAMHWRLEGGVPQLTFDQLVLESEPFAELVAQVGTVLLHHNPNWQIELADQSPDALVTLVHEVFETWDTLTAPRSAPPSEAPEQLLPDYSVALAVGFALASYLQKASEVILPRLDLSLWTQGHCPVCGGRPNFALLEKESGARKLMCSRCTSLWPYRRLGCPFCASQEKQTYYPSRDGAYRLYVCPHCNRYLKTIDLREVYRKVYPMVERLLTVGMDLAAQQEGYGD